MKWLWATSCAAAAMALSTPAMAFHESEHPQNTDTTAYSVPKAQHRIGLFEMRYGITDTIEVGFSPPTWSILFPNAAIAWRFLDIGPVDLKASIAGMYLSTRIIRQVVDVPIADVGVIPANLIASFALHDDLRWSLGGLMTGVIIDGVVDDDLIAGSAATNNLQLHTTLGWRLSRRVALELRGRYQAFQTTKAQVAARLQPDDFTEITAEAVAESDIFEFPHAYNIVLLSHLSWEAFNLSLGVGYGNYTIPVVNFVLPKRGFVPVVDFYWRF